MLDMMPSVGTADHSPEHHDGDLAFVMHVSVGGLFLAGLVPGILMGVLLMVMTRLVANRKGLPPGTTRATVTIN